MPGNVAIDAMDAAPLTTAPSEEKSGYPTKNNDVVVSEGEVDATYPTEEERVTLRRMPGPIRVEAYLIAFVELCERFSYYGTTAVFTNFIQQPRPEGSRTGAGHGGQSGALGLGQQTANGLTTFNQFWIYVTPLMGGYIADTYLGRYNMIALAVVVAQIGHILLICSALPSVIDNPNSAVGLFAVAIVIMGLGTGGFKSSVSPMVAEQVTVKRLTIHVTNKGERVLWDPAMTISRVYMYFYCMINIGAVVGQVGMVYAERDVGFWLSFTLPTIIFFLAFPVLYFARNRYIRTPPSGSAIAEAAKFIKFATKGRWSNPKRLFAADMWENAKPSHIVGPKPGWMTFDDVYVDEIRRALKACQVFVWYPLYWLSYNQINNNLTSQAATMNVGNVPNDVINNLDPIAVLVLVPLADMIVYPFLRRRGYNFSPLKKITCGFFAACFAMIWASVLQYYIYQKSACGTSAATCDTVADINVWTQTGSYVLVAASEIFASITGLEYAYTKAPKSMRTVVMGLFLLTNAFAAAIGEAFNPLATDPLLIWNYGVFAVISFFAGFGFWFSFRSLDAAEDELNEITERSERLDELEAAGLARRTSEVTATGSFKGSKEVAKV